jgi:uncharacterized protein YciI
MAYFTIMCLDRPGSAEGRTRLREKHRAFFTDIEKAMLKFATVLTDASGEDCGALYVLEADAVDGAHAWCRREPYCAAGIYREIAIAEMARPPFNMLPYKPWD